MSLGHIGKGRGVPELAGVEWDETRLGDGSTSPIPSHHISPFQHVLACFPLVVGDGTAPSRELSKHSSFTFSTESEREARAWTQV